VEARNNPNYVEVIQIRDSSYKPEHSATPHFYLNNHPGSILNTLNTLDTLYALFQALDYYNVL
jgi:hypothetical protein